VVDGRGGGDGTDTLVDVERLVFSDVTVRFDTDGVGGQAYRLYKAAFNREPDLPGLGHWIGQLDAGADLTAVAQAFVQSEEFGRLYGSDLDNETFATQVYGNVLGRAPDAEGLNYWVANLQNGQSRADVLKFFSESDENIDAVSSAIANGIAYEASHGFSAASQGLSLVGQDGRDGFVSGSGNDTIDGALGTDRVRYAGNRAEYTVVEQGEGLVVTDGQSGRDGMDTLVSIERLEFADRTLAFDTGEGEIAGMGYRLYSAAFDREPDLGGLGYWIGQLDAGADITDVAQAFVQSEEFGRLYGSDLDNEGFVTQVYTNVLDRGPDAEGLSYWVDNMDQGQSRAEVLRFFSESGENLINTAELVASGVDYFV